MVDRIPSAPDPEEDGRSAKRQLHPLPKGVVEFYGILAVLFVLVPEWMAASLMAGFRVGSKRSELPLRSMAWDRLPELRLATMSLAELRLLARRKHLCGYASLTRDRLSARLLKRMRRRCPRSRRA